MPNYLSPIVFWLPNQILYSNDLNNQIAEILYYLIPEPSFSVQGDLLTKSNDQWVLLHAGAPGQILVSNGPNENLSWTQQIQVLGSKGSILYNSTGTEVTSLTIGNQGQILLVSSGVPAWGGMQTLGDMETFDGTNRLVVPRGTQGQFLQQGQYLPVWETVPPTLAVPFQSYLSPPFGTQTLGNVDISTNTQLAQGTNGVQVVQYGTLTVDAGMTFQAYSSDTVLVILCQTLNINGTILMDGHGGVGGVSSNSAPTAGGVGAFGGGGGGNGLQYAYGGSASTPGTQAVSPYWGFGGGVLCQLSSDGKTFSQATFPYNLGGFQYGRGGDVKSGSSGVNAACYIDSPILTPFIFNIARYLTGAGGGCGGIGSISPLHLGGNGGSGGGVLWIEAQTINWGTNGIISANGNNGQSGSTTAAGGGGGGAGGFVQIVYHTQSGYAGAGNTPGGVIQANGGTGGSGHNSGGSGANGVIGEFNI